MLRSYILEWELSGFPAHGSPILGNPWYLCPRLGKYLPEEKMREIRSLSYTGESEDWGVNQCLEIPLSPHWPLDELAWMGWTSCAALWQPALDGICSTFHTGIGAVGVRRVTWGLGFHMFVPWKSFVYCSWAFKKLLAIPQSSHPLHLMNYSGLYCQLFLDF